MLLALDFIIKWRKMLNAGDADINMTVYEKNSLPVPVSHKYSISFTHVVRHQFIFLWDT